MENNNVFYLYVLIVVDNINVMSECYSYNPGHVVFIHPAATSNICVIKYRDLW